jgi:hypothetical protein
MVDDPGFGCAKGDPVTRNVLEGDEELLTALLGFGVEFFSAVKLSLE